MPRASRATDAAMIAAALALAACGRLETGAAQPRTLAARGNADATAPRPVDVRPVPVSEPAPDPLSDTVMAARIRASLLTDPAMAGADVSANIDRGVVNLTGTVKSQEQAVIAASHARRQDGVMRIDNHLSVNPQ